MGNGNRELITGGVIGGLVFGGKVITGMLSPICLAGSAMFLTVGGVKKLYPDKSLSLRKRVKLRFAENG
ncbi:MAG: hypothetical protein ABIH11_03155 [Candidatus Altiarchaeota archaeon]